jgi:hypothetical protein
MGSLLSTLIAFLPTGREGDEVPDLTFVLGSEYKMADAMQILIDRVVIW